MGDEKKKKKKKKKKKHIPAVWFTLCKSHPSDFHYPTADNRLSVILARKPARSGCSRSIANLKDVVIHGSKRHLQEHEQEQQHHPNNSSPRSIGSSDFVNPITPHLIFTKSHLKITTTPTPSSTPPRKLGFQNSPISSTSSRRSSSSSSFCNNNLVCHKCGDSFPKLEALENHHFSTHSVTDLVDGDSARKIVEIICKSSLTEAPSIKIDRVLKIHNSPKTISRFEAYRESVKMRASKLPKKHPRCLADGNELLRFHGARLGCTLSAGVCDGRRCNVCRIIRGVVAEIGVGGVGVFTASTSGRAYEEIMGSEGKKAVVVCRVIAGRVHRPVAEVEGVRLTGFDSLAGKLGVYSNIEELYLLNPKALLPCFLVICNS